MLFGSVQQLFDARRIPTSNIICVLEPQSGSMCGEMLHCRAERLET